MNADFPVEMNEVLQTIESSEVITLLFPIIRHSLVVDTRTSSEAGPMVRAMPQTRGLEERIRAVHRLRPQFARPDHLVVIPWPKYITSLVSLGVADALAKRLTATGSSEAMRELRQAIEQLARLERQEMVAVISGQGDYRTIWSANE